MFTSASRDIELILAFAVHWFHIVLSVMYAMLIMFVINVTVFCGREGPTEVVS